MKAIFLIYLKKKILFEKYMQVEQLNPYFSMQLLTNA